MKTIKKDTTFEMFINKSRFICILCNINSKEEVLEKLNYYKSSYKDATHYCYAYIIDSYMKCDDDKEPSGTAGVPILNVLKNNKFEHILCIVIRYFGGIKLGAGGLVRAYSRSVSECLKEAEVVNLSSGFEIEISFDYNYTKYIDNLVKDFDIKKKFDEKVIYSFKISVLDFQKIESLLKEKARIIKKESILTIV